MTAEQLKEKIQAHALLAADYRAADVPEAERLHPLVFASIEALNVAVVALFKERDEARAMSRAILREYGVEETWRLPWDEAST